MQGMLGRWWVLPIRGFCLVVWSDGFWWGFLDFCSLEFSFRKALVFESGHVTPEIADVLFFRPVFLPLYPHNPEHRVKMKLLYLSTIVIIHDTFIWFTS